MKRGFLFSTVAVAVLLISASLFFTPILIISDPVWRVTVLEGDEGIYFRLRMDLLKRGYIPKLVVPESFSAEKNVQISAGDLVKTAETRRRGPILLSPGLSFLSVELAELIPDRALIAFAEGETGGSTVRITADPADALKEAGTVAKREFSTEESRLFLPVREVKPAEEDSHAKAFIEGWGDGEVLRISMGENTLEEELRRHGAGKKDFACLSEGDMTGRVLPILAEYGVLSCCFGPYALTAYPETVVCELRYTWREALLEALSYVGRSDEEPDITVRMGAELNCVLFRK